MLTVWCVLWGDKYTPDYVQLLRNMVGAHLQVPFIFKCITDSAHEWEGVEKVAPIHPEWIGWWQKLQLFALADGPSLYFDLDVVITGTLNYLADYAVHEFAAPANWAQSGHGGVQSSVMAWNGNWREPFTRFNYEVDSKRLWGDQEFITEIRGGSFKQIPGVKSYKYHCQNGSLPGDAAVVVFHGKPDPHEVGDAWVKQLRFIQTRA
jgi:hypothetical protein